MHLDVPYPEEERLDVINKYMIEYNCTYEQAVSIDSNRNWMGAVAKRFFLETNCIVLMFLRLLGKYKNEDTIKIVVDCVKSLKGIGGTTMGICLIEQIVDYNAFFSKNDLEKKQFTLDVIKEAISKIARDKDWDISPFEEVYKRIIELEYTNHWTWKKKLNSPNRLFTAEVYLEHEIKDIKIYIIIRNKLGDIIKRQLIITEMPDDYIYILHLGKLKWLSNNDVQLVNKYNTMHWNVQLES